MKNQMKKNGQKRRYIVEKKTEQRRKNKRLETKKGQHKQWSNSDKTKSTNFERSTER